jgi:hypothetical protein
VTVYLPDDLEQRYAELKAVVQDADGHSREDRLAALRTIQAWHQRWRDARQELTWQQRRVIRKICGGEPITPQGISPGRLADREREQRQDREARLARQRIERTYGADGAAAIFRVRDRLLMARPGIPEARALAWAEDKYERGEVLT